MNPIDHPLGGGEGRSNGGRHPVSKTGVPARRAALTPPTEEAQSEKLICALAVLARTSSGRKNQSMLSRRVGSRQEGS